MIICCDLVSSLGFDIHGPDITIHWDYASIPLREIDYTKKYVFVISQYNTPFNSETKRMKHIIYAKYKNPILKPSQKAPLILILMRETSFTHY